MSSYTPVSLPGGTDKTWRECDTIPPSVTLGEGEGALSRSSKNHTDWLVMITLSAVCAEVRSL
ncbi:hypothetical protein AB0K15_36275 [Amycolatopsis sp. NPDC049253]|uniref:hypothetical protein n=1 Tax=Amycolatopsis sp. NPDC049253 TaxID=3155274 RepID=UPI00342DB072